MKRFLGVVLAVVAVLAAGCTYSLHPLYLPGQQVFDDRLIGTWVNEEGDWRYEITEQAGAFQECLALKEKDSLIVCPYQLVTRQRFQRTSGDVERVGNFEVVLIALDGKLFLDVSPARSSELYEFGEMYLYVPVHTFIRVWAIEPSFRISEYDGDEEANNEILPHVHQGENIIFTASTQQLQAFLLRHDEIKGFWNGPVELTRKPAE